MGACSSTKEIDLTRKDVAGAYEFGPALGQGGFGDVYKVTHKETQQVSAMKVMKKARVLTKKAISSVLYERKILEDVQNPFIVNMKYAFQDYDNLYLILDYMEGGDLRYHINKGIEFNEEQTKFIAACIIIALSELHQKKIMHRDLKPENLVFDSKGYLKLTDFGIARYHKKNNQEQVSGTPGYMALEVLMKQPHGHTVDFYALGIILYEIIYGEKPYMGKDRKEIQKKVIRETKRLSKADLPDKSWDKYCADFVTKLMKIKPSRRLGYRGAEEVMNHKWMRDFNWRALYEGKLKSPFIPKVYEGESGGSFIGKPDQEEVKKDKKSQQLLRRNSIQEAFSRYTYDPDGIFDKEIRDRVKEREKSGVIPKIKSDKSKDNQATRDPNQKTTILSPTKKKKKTNLGGSFLPSINSNHNIDDNRNINIPNDHNPNRIFPMPIENNNNLHNNTNNNQQLDQNPSLIQHVSSQQQEFQIQPQSQQELPEFENDELEEEYIQAIQEEEKEEDQDQDQNQDQEHFNDMESRVSRINRNRQRSLYSEMREHSVDVI